MKVINLYGSSGVGKSRGAAYIFADLKMRGFNAELVTEFAKDCTWEGRHATLHDQIYVFAKQNHRLFRLNEANVEVVVTDCPIFLSEFYNQYYNFGSKALPELIQEEMRRYDNLNYLVERVSKFNPAGRNQDEAESNEMQKKIQQCMEDYKLPYSTISGSEIGYNFVIQDFLRKNREK